MKLRFATLSGHTEILEAESFGNFLTLINRLYIQHGEELICYFESDSQSIELGKVSHAFGSKAKEIWQAALGISDFIQSFKDIGGTKVTFATKQQPNDFHTDKV